MSETIRDYAHCREILKNRMSRKLGNNTYLKLDDSNEYYILFHKTRIATYHRYDGLITLNTGGYQTVTTKDRLNRFTPVRVFSENGVWYIYYLNKRYTWKDNVLIDYNGKPLNTEEDDGKRDKLKHKLDRMVKSYVKGYVHHYLKLKQAPAVDLGDCLFCRIFATDSDVDHLLSHIEEKYYVGSLFIKAVQESNHSTVHYILDYSFKAGREHWMMQHILSTYFRKRKHKMLEYMLNSM